MPPRTSRLTTNGRTQRVKLAATRNDLPATVRTIDQQLWFLDAHLRSGWSLQRRGKPRPYDRPVMA